MPKSKKKNRSVQKVVEFPLTNDMSDTKNYVECRIPLLIKKGIATNEDGIRRFLYASCEMEKYAEFYKYDCRCVPLGEGQGQVLFNMVRDGVRCERYIWLLEKQTDTPDKPAFILYNEGGSR